MNLNFEVLEVMVRGIKTEWSPSPNFTLSAAIWFCEFYKFERGKVSANSFIIWTILLNTVPLIVFSTWVSWRNWDRPCSGSSIQLPGNDNISTNSKTEIIWAVDKRLATMKWGWKKYICPFLFVLFDSKVCLEYKVICNYVCAPCIVFYLFLILPDSWICHADRRTVKY